VSEGEKQGDAKQCAYCGEPFTPRRSTARFCCDTHRKSAFKAAKRFDKSQRRSAMSVSFDGLTGGKPRDTGRTRLGHMPTGWAESIDPTWEAVSNRDGKDGEAEQAIRDNRGMGVGRLLEHLASLNIKRGMTWIHNTIADIQRKEGEAHA